MKLHKWQSYVRISSTIVLLLAIHLNIYSSNDISLVSHTLEAPKFTIVIDAGHGGKDSGCSNHSCIEKDLNLIIAKELGAILKYNSDKIDIIYTRYFDNFISLEDRIHTANKHKADLFISVHCNANEVKSVNGSETYVAGLDFINADRNEYLQKHNSISDQALEVLEGQQLSKPVKMILLKESLDLASEIEKSLGSGLPYKSRGVIEAGFTVLKYLTMPGVLVEAGYLSNKKQSDYMQSDEGLLAISQSIADGILSYLDKIPVDDILAERVQNVSQNIPTKEPTHHFTYTLELHTSASKPLIQFDSKWDQLSSIQIVKISNNFHYRTGNYLNIGSAQNAIPGLIELGFDDVRIVKVLSKVDTPILNAAISR